MTPQVAVLFISSDPWYIILYLMNVFYVLLMRWRHKWQQRVQCLPPPPSPGVTTGLPSPHGLKHALC